MANYKDCFVLTCSSTTIETPQKLFFRVPSERELKRKWFNSVGRKDVPPVRVIYYCCEDHFTLEEDLENYIKFKLVGGRLRLKKGVLPHVFNCHNHQTDKLASHPVHAKLNRRRVISKQDILDIGNKAKTIHTTKRNDCDEVFYSKVSTEIPLDPSLIVVIESGLSDNVISNNEKTTYAIPPNQIDKQPFTPPVLPIKQELVEVDCPQSLTHQNDETREIATKSPHTNRIYNTTQHIGAVEVEPEQEKSKTCQSSTEYIAYEYPLWTTNPRQDVDETTPTPVEESKLKSKQERTDPADMGIIIEDDEIPIENYPHNHRIKNEDSERTSTGIMNNENEYCFMNYRNSIVLHVKRNGSSIDEIFKCAKCDCTSRQQPDLLRHIRMFHDADAVPYKCTECSYSTTWKHYLRDHYRAEHHASDLLQECPQCNYTSKLRYDFDKPIDKKDLAVSVMDKKQSKCDTANETKYIHVRKQVTANVFMCPKCNYQAKWKYELNRHLHKGCDRHTTEVYKCARCSYTTKNHVRLIAHLRLKHKPKPLTHNCTKCSFATGNKKYLSMHERRLHDPHADVHMCTECNYSCKGKKSLLKHITKKHDTNAIRYQCASCPFVTTWRSDLLNHFRVRHRDSVKTFQCARCSYTTRHKALMIKHLKNEHPRDQ